MRLPVNIAAAAVAVTAPRLALAFLQADGISIDPSTRATWLTVAAVATALVLTGGATALAHEIARQPGRRGLLGFFWVSALLSTGVLITPAIVAGLGSQGFASVLASPELRWAWSWAAVLAPDLMAAGLVLAAAGAREGVAEDAEHGLVSPSGYIGLGLAGGSRVAPAPHEPPSFPCSQGCGRVFASPSGEAGHRRACPMRKEEAA